MSDATALLILGLCFLARGAGWLIRRGLADSAWASRSTPVDADWASGYRVGSLAALIGGLLAAANTGRGSDEQPEPTEMAVTVPAVALPVEEADTFTAYPWEVGHAY